MKIVALMTVRNEELYMDRCLRHLREQGVRACLIDNGSIDATLSIARSHEGGAVMRIDSLPYDGRFDLTRILANEERLAREIDADWFIHHDADEIREAPAGFGTLADALSRADRDGCNAVQFDEFVFAPVTKEESHERGDYVKSMSRYYFFEPRPLHRVNAWKKNAFVRLTASGGHSAEFDGRRIFPERFALRHYIALSFGHLVRKYGRRQFSETDLAKGWHGDRVRFLTAGARLPDAGRMKTLGEGGSWDKSDPWTAHPFFPAP